MVNSVLFCAWYDILGAPLWSVSPMPTVVAVSVGCKPGSQAGTLLLANYPTYAVPIPFKRMPMTTADVQGPLTYGRRRSYW
jgi:hypothetical protein